MKQAQMRVVLATTNQGKLAEFRGLLSAVPIDLVSAARVVPDLPAVEEDGLTFEENAKKKAFAVAQATGLWTLADDSGLEVQALGGAPGVRSARYAGEHATDTENNAALLRALAGVPMEQRKAQFRCVLCLIDPSMSLVRFVQGRCEGRIGLASRGTGGFGYDPLFVIDGDGRTLAELSIQEKNGLSHRGRAVSALVPVLRELLIEP